MHYSQNPAEFEFVVSTPTHNASAQKSTQRLVRKHVMRPWMRGKARSRAIVLQEDDLAEYLAQRKHRGDDISSSTTSSPSPAYRKTEFPQRTLSVSAGSPSIAAALLGAARPNPFGRYPIKMKNKELQLIHHIWASGQVAFQPFRNYWFTLGMLDPAAMHLVIANAALHLQSLRYRSSPEENLVALTHVEAAMTSVNQRIADSTQNTTDEMLGAILGLMCHAENSLRFDHYARHAAGFQTILDLRGGLVSIESAIYIRLSLFWIEVNTCAAQDIIPQFPPPFHLIKNQYSAIHKSFGKQHFDKAIEFSHLSSYLSSEMLDIFNELSLLTAALTVESPQNIRWDNDNFPGFGFYPTLHKLLAIQANPNEDDLENAVQEMCRLGALFFLAEIRRRFGIAPIVTSVYSQKLHKLLESNEILWDTELDSVRVWVLMMAACAADSPAARARAVKSLVLPGGSWGLETWDKTINLVAKMWWIDEVFSPKLQEVEVEYGELSSTIS